MKEKPIIFSTEMAKALLNTKPDVWPAEPIDDSKPFKSQTRRVIKPRYRENESGFEVATHIKSGYMSIHILNEEGGYSRDYDPPYDVGDILWVRETYLKLSKEHYMGYSWYAYKATTDSESEDVRKEYIKHGYLYQWKPSIHMPHEAARIFLEVKSVRVRRLQEIDTVSCVLEGVEFGNAWTANAKPTFIKLWESTNAKRGYSWEANPWVWVYEFMRVDKSKLEVL